MLISFYRSLFKSPQLYVQYSLYHPVLYKVSASSNLRLLRVWRAISVLYLPNCVEALDTVLHNQCVDDCGRCCLPLLLQLGIQQNCIFIVLCCGYEVSSTNSSVELNSHIDIAGTTTYARRRQQISLKCFKISLKLAKMFKTLNGRTFKPIKSKESAVLARNPFFKRIIKKVQPKLLTK